MTSWEKWIRGASPSDANATVGDAWRFSQHAEKLVNRLGSSWVRPDFEPSEADKTAAWTFYTELRSRIVTRPLHYLDGDERTALTSVFNLFALARKVCEDNGPECFRFACLVWTLLNNEVRPLTAKWHKRFVDDKLREDDRHEFREELEKLQETVRYFEQLFLALSRNHQIGVPLEDAAEQPQGLTDPSTAFPFDRILFSPSIDDATAILEAERTAIRKRREVADDADVANTTGLALSGGGLRSATFALGALQGLAKQNMLADFDYLSTVSGGGYAGSFLSCYLNSKRDASDKSIGLNSNQLPFKRDDARESAPMRHLRSSSKALLTGGFWRKLEIPVLALLGWLASIAVALPPIALLTVLACYTNREAIERAFQGTTIYPNWTVQHTVVLGSALAVLVGLILVGVVQHFRRRWGTRADLPAGLIAIVGCVLLFALLLVGWILFPFGAKAMAGVTNGPGIKIPALSESVIAAITAAVIPVFSRLASRAKKASPLKPIFTAIAVAILPIIFVWMVATLLAKYALFVGENSGISFEHVSYWLWGSLIALVFCLLVLNVNAVSLHPFYRDRLARAYHLTESGDGVQASAKQKLSKLREHNRLGPYHLINAALNAPAGDNEALRGRSADFFLFSNKYCGSESTGYRETDKFEKADRSVDLATAIAISGAAASPFMGVNNSQFNFWATLLNIRLDYWLPIPGRVKFRSPGAAYWLSQYIGRVNDTTAYVNLSDGGHIENMGLYELLRRRCRYIVVVDGECDPGITCGSFLQAIRYAKIDFGIEIKIELSRLKVADVRSANDDGTSTEPMPTGKSASPTVDFHFALGRIEYDERLVGLLLYLKSSVSGNEGKPIESYREREPEFPHQSTADLAYDEQQFEAYRSLGEHIVVDTFRDELVGESKPTNVASWLHALEARLHR